MVKLRAEAVGGGCFFNPAPCSHEVGQHDGVDQRGEDQGGECRQKVVLHSRLNALVENPRIINRQTEYHRHHQCDRAQ